MTIKSRYYDTEAKTGIMEIVFITLYNRFMLLADFVNYENTHDLRTVPPLGVPTYILSIVCVFTVMHTGIHTYIHRCMHAYKP